MYRIYRKIFKYHLRKLSHKAFFVIKMSGKKEFKTLAWWIGLAILVTGLWIAVGLSYAVASGKFAYFYMYAYSSVALVIVGIIIAAIGKLYKKGG